MLYERVCSLELDTNLLQWHHNGRDSVSNHQPHDCLFNRLFRRRSKTTPKLRVTGLCAGNSSGTGELPAQMASSAENVSIWWRHHAQWQRHIRQNIIFRGNLGIQICVQAFNSLYIFMFDHGIINGLRYQIYTIITYCICSGCEICYCVTKTYNCE